MKEISYKQRRFIENLRADLGDSGTEIPASSRAASMLINDLLRRQEARDRRAVAVKPARLEVQESIWAMAARLGLEVKPSWLTEGQASFVLDDLRARERRERHRVADGSAG